ncbi:energy transducer TonB [Kaistella sp. DKR-2]|uniref:energy transducer TonB n=1 Tax=Kaistella soli TaxID=2849654 RepID=UPI001C26C018|nr:energy transducer TonB [Kaistella soli]MBU8884172.1 energy transducer TonB [Kaistella soli]
MKQKIIISIFFLNFTLIFAQVEEIRKIDNIYDKKTKEIKEVNKRAKKYLPILSELNKERIAEYDKILKPYYLKDSTEFTDHQNEFMEKIEKFENGEKVEGVLKNQIPEKTKNLDYKNGGIGGFRNEIGKFVIIENLPFFYNYNGIPLRSELKFTIDKEGLIKNVTAVGDNEAFNTLVKVALYKTSGNWIPSEINGRKVNDQLRFPINFQVN